MPLRRSALVAFASFCSIASALGCSPTAETTTGSGGSGAGGGAGGGFDPGGEVTTYAASMGPITIGPGVEKTQCITVRVDNAVGAFVRRFRTTLLAGSHHMIVYRSSATSEAKEPVDCDGFSGLFDGDHPIFIAQQEHSELALPRDESGTPVALEITPGQMVRIEMHYVNTTAAPLDVKGTVELDTIPLETTVVRSDLAFWGTQFINIPPNGEKIDNPRFQPALANTKTFALTTHQHHFGTRMRVWHATDVSDTAGTPVADGTTWSDPPLERFDPPLDFPDSGDGKMSSKGFAYQCEWKNTTPNSISFGEGFDDEMCFLWHYYYPSQGFQLCIDGFCKKPTE